MRKLIKTWFENWESGDYFTLPITEDFSHTSPFGTIKGKKEYRELIEENKDKFLGYRFEIHDAIYDRSKACVRYTAIQDHFSLDVSEWYYAENKLIGAIIAYYHIGKIREDRKLEKSNN